MTTVGDMLYELGGVPVSGRFRYIKQNAWFVNSDGGNNANSGKTWNQAFNTISKAVSESSEYDVIYVAGSTNSAGQTNDYSESVEIPYAKNGLRLIGCGNSPSEGVLWTVAAANGVILSVKARDVYVSGFRFRPNGATSRAIELHRSTSSATSDCSGFTVENCVFRSTVTTGYGIDAGAKITSGGATNQGPNDVTIRNCTFDSVLAAIRTGPSDATIGSRLRVEDVFITGSCTTGILTEIRRSLFKNVNISDLGGTLLDLDPGGNAATKDNMVVNCTLGDGNTTIDEVNATTTDNWISSFFGNPADSTQHCDATGLFIISPDGGVST